MGTFNAGAVEAKLILDRSTWSADLKKTEKEIADLERKSISIGIELSDDDVQAELDKLSATLEKFEQKSVKPELELDTDFVEEQIEWFEKELDRLDGRKVTVEIDVDLDNAKVALDNFERNDLDVLDNDPVNIEINVDLDDAYAKLTELELRLDRLDLRRVVIEVDADTDNAMVAFSAIEAEMDVLEAQAVHIDIEVDDLAAQIALTDLYTSAAGLELMNPTINVDVDSAAARANLTAIAAQATAVGRMSPTISVDVDRGGLESLVGSGGGGGGGGGSLGLLKLLLIAIIGLAPILVVATSAMSAALVAMAGAIVVALAPAIIAAGGLIGLIQRFNDTEPEDYSPGMQAFADSIESVKDAWSDVLDVAEDAGAFEMMAKALELVADILPRLTPVFEATIDMFDGILDGLARFVDSPQFDEMIAFFADFGVDMLEAFISIGGDLIVFFGELFAAMEPFTRKMMDGLVEAADGWADTAAKFSENQGFIDWLDRAAYYGPMVLEMLGAFWRALMNVAEALEPFAGPAIEALTDFFNFVADMDPDLLGPIILALGAMYIGMTVVVPMISSIIGLIGTLAAVGGAMSSPIVLAIAAIVAGLAALGFLFYETWQDSEQFRDNVMMAFEDIKATVEPIVSDIVDFIKENWGPLTEWATAVFGDIKGIISEAMESIRRLTAPILAAIRALWAKFGDNILQVVKGAFQIIGNTIRGAFGVIRGLFQIFNGIISGDWSRVWEGIKRVVQSVTGTTQGVIRGFMTILRGLFSGARTAISGIWSAMWGAMSRPVEAAMGAVQRIVQRVSDAISGIISGIVGAIQNVKDGINGVIGKWNNTAFTTPKISVPGPLPDIPSITVGTPDIGYFARGGYVTEPTLGVIGEGADNEIVAPEPMLKQIVRDNSGGNIDYGMLAAAVAAAIRAIPGIGGITQEDLERLIEAASVNLSIDARSEGTTAAKIAKAVGFELRVLGYGGK